MGMEEGDGDLPSLCSPSPLPVRSSSASRMVVIAGHSSGNVKVVVGTGEERRIGGDFGDRQGRDRRGGRGKLNPDTYLTLL